MVETEDSPWAISTISIHPKNSLVFSHCAGQGNREGSKKTRTRTKNKNNVFIPRFNNKKVETGNIPLSKSFQ
jgi:hypothetical protein